MAVELATGYVSLTVSARGIQQQIASELGAPLAAVGAQTGQKIGDNISAGLATRLRSSGSRIAEAGQSLTLGLTAPLAAIGFIAFKAATDFESAFAGVKKTVDGTVPELNRIRQGIIDMANEIPASREEIAAVAEAAGQLGVKTGAILDFTRTMIDLGNTTDLSADQAASAIARLANITGLPQDQFDNLGATIVDLGNKSAATESEITEMALRIAGAGTQVGLSEADILSFGAALSSVGVDAEAGGSAISRVFVSLDQAVKTGGAQLETFASVAGQSTADFKKSFETDAAGASVAFITGLKRISDEGGNVFAVLDQLGLSDIRVRDALLRASGAGDLFATTLKTGNQAFKDNSALTEEAGKRYETTASQLEVAKNQATDVARQFGEALAPAVISAANAAGPLVDALKIIVDAFKALPGPIQTGVVALAALAAAAGPVAFFAGNIAKGVSGLISGFQAVSSGAGKAQSAITAFFSAGGGKDKVSARFTQIRAAASSVGSALKGATTSVASFAKSSALAAAGMAKQAAAFVAQKTAALAAAVATKAMAIAQGLLNIVMAANPIVLVVLAIAALVAAFIFAYNNITPFREAVDGVAHALQTGFKAAVEAVSAAMEFLAGIFNGFDVSDIALLLVAPFIEIPRLIIRALFGVDIVDEFISWIGPVSEALVGFFEELPGRLKGLLDPVELLKLLVGGPVQLIGKLFGVDVIDGILNFIPTALGRLKGLLNPVDLLKLMIGGPAQLIGKILGVDLIDGLVNILGQLAPSVGGIFDAAFGLAKEAIRGVVDFIIDNWPIALALLTGGLSLAVGFIIANWEAIKTAVGTGIDFIVDAIQSVFGGLIAFWTAQWNLAVAIVSTVWNVITQTIGDAIADVVAVIQFSLAVITAIWTVSWNALSGIVASIWGAITAAVSNGLNFVRAVFNAFTGGFNAAWSAFWGGLAGVVQGIAGAVGGAFEAVLSTIRSGWNAIARFLNGIHISIPAVDLGPLGEIGGGSFDLPNVPLLATGAIVKPRPGGTQAVIGERGVSEAVIPLPKLKDLAKLIGAPVDGGGSQGPSVLIESMNVWNGEEAASAIAAAQSWRSKTDGRV